MSKIDPTPLIEGINDALAELAAIAVVDDQQKLDWMPALINNNPADARCLATAYSRLQEAISRVTPREEDKQVVDLTLAKPGMKCIVKGEFEGTFIPVPEMYQPSPYAVEYHSNGKRIGWNDVDINGVTPSGVQFVTAFTPPVVEDKPVETIVEQLPYQLTEADIGKVAYFSDGTVSEKPIGKQKDFQKTGDFYVPHEAGNHRFHSDGRHYFEPSLFVISVASPTPSPADGTAEWAEKMAKEGKRVRMTGFDEEDYSGIFWNGQWFVWHNTGSICVHQKLTDYQPHVFGTWELVPEDPAPAPADAGGEVKPDLVGEWALDDRGELVYVHGTSMAGLENPHIREMYLCEAFRPKPNELRTFFCKASELTHLPGFNPLTDKVIDGKHYRPVS